MNTAEDEVRRKMVVDLIPYLVAAYVKAQSTLTPAALLSSAVESFGNRGREMANNKKSLQAALSGIEDLDLKAEGRGFAFRVDRKTLLEIARAYLVRAYITEGSHGAPFLLDSPASGPSFDAVLKLPIRSVFVRVLSEGLTADLESKYLESAVRMAPSQVWVLTLEDSNVDSKLNPVFRSENKVLFGGLRILGLGRILEDYLGGTYSARVESSDEGFKVNVVRRSS